MLENWTNRVFFEKNSEQFFKKFLRTNKMQFRQPRRKISLKGQKFLLCVQNFWKNLNFKEKIIQSKIEIGQVESCFTIPSKRFQKKCRLIFALCPRETRKTEFFQKKNFSKKTGGHSECCFDKPSKIFLKKDRKNLLSLSERVETKKIFKEVFSLKSSFGQV